MDKLNVYNNAPYDETIFIDADISIVDDISFLFMAFERNGSDISCLGSLKPNDGKDKPYMWGDVVVEKYGLHSFMSFNGGVYYFKKSSAAQICIDRIFNELLPNYDNLQLTKFRKTLRGDEPLFGLSMLISGFSPLNYGFDIVGMPTHRDNLRSLRWNQKRKNCSIYCWNRWVSPKIIHWGLAQTLTLKYKLYNLFILEDAKILRIFKVLQVVISHGIQKIGLLITRAKRKIKQRWVR